MHDLTAIKSHPGRVEVNYEEIKAHLEQEVARYDIVVTADTVKDSKKLATELNKTATELDRRMKAAIDEARAPIDAAHEQRKELVGICKEGRRKILEQVERYEEQTREKARSLLSYRRAEQWLGQGVNEEFQCAEYEDLVKITAVTATGNLSKAARDEIDRRVMDDKALQDRTELRLAKLEAASYRAGLDAPLTRNHVEPFLFADDERYAAELQRIIDSELERQRLAEQRRQAREQREQEAAEARERADAERAARRDEAAQKQGEATEPQPIGTAPYPPTEPGPIGAGSTPPPDPELLPWEQPDETVEPTPSEGGRVPWTVTCTFSTSTEPGVSAEAVERELRRVLEKAGISTLTSLSAKPRHGRAA